MRAIAPWLMASLCAGCGGYAWQIDAPDAVPVGSRVEAEATAACQPGAVGCPGGPLKIRRFEVGPSGQATQVERTGDRIAFTAAKAGEITVQLDAEWDGDVQRRQHKLTSLKPDGVESPDCAADGALVAGFKGTAQFWLSAGGRRLTQRAPVIAAEPKAVRHRSGATHVIDGKGLAPGSTVQLTAPQVPGWKGALTVVDRARIDGVRLSADRVKVGESADLNVQLSADGKPICRSLDLSWSATVETPETCSINWPEAQRRTRLWVRGRAKGECRVRLGVGAHPVAKLRIE